MADYTHVPDPPQPANDTGSGWGIRAPKDTANHDWDAPPAPLPPPLPALVHAPAPMLEGAPPPPLPPPLAPHRAPPPPPGGLPGKPRNRMVMVGAGILAVALIGGGTLYFTGKPTESVVPLSTPVPSTVAVVHAGPAQLTLESLTGGGPTQTVKLPGAPDEVVTTPDRTKAFLLDTSHGDVIPVNLVSGHVGAPIAAGKLPVDEELSADGSTLYVTDNLGGTVIPINTSTGSVAPAQALTQGVAFYVPSPSGSSALVGVSTSAGLPGVVYFSNATSGAGSQIAVGSNPAEYAFYSKDGTTVWIVEDGSNGQPGLLIPLDVATQKPGAAIKLGVAPDNYAVTPNGDYAVFANEASNTVSIVDLVTHAVKGTVAVGALPSGVAVDATGTTAWVACALSHSLVPVNLVTHKASAAVALGNAPGGVTVPAAAGVAWVLFPASNGSINFLSGTSGPLRRSIPVGNGPGALIGTGSETSWVANSQNSTVQQINVAGQSAGPAILVAHSPVNMKLTADGSTLLVLSYGDGTHAGDLTAINTATSELSKPLAVGPAPGQLLVSPTSGLAYVASYVARTITVIDPTAWHIDTTLKLPCGPTDLAITPDGNQLFAGCADSGAIVGISLSNNKFQGVIGVPSIRQLVMPGDGSTLLVVGDNGLYNVDINTDKVVKAVAETGNLVDVVETPDGNTILAVDNSGAALVMINPATLVTIKSLAVGTRPGEVALSPDGTHAYVLDTSEQRLFVVDVLAWKVGATINVAPNAIDIAVPSPVVVPPS